MGMELVHKHAAAQGSYLLCVVVNQIVCTITTSDHNSPLTTFDYRGVVASFFMQHYASQAFIYTLLTYSTSSSSLDDEEME